ncbi:hypothetical protein FOXG_07566 [Fusarium oxysporum f. sp. lycopersici 4287]|uniref:Uncharacterized protein n=2 Tax=Fusarium oxysporum TaxID=5507 RepID=A0A0J9V270_FUSO4|nr:hypothetical protein FOXG_07566 [Fusarium oxysporum f. sp. lycopersici 4287]EXK46044.1 hypothetical protein FOMG_04270 [Fusarium oxysporum f. sp. melonis 26406]KNB05223.1 hypothetical protein FOXG_07566 [Fusarium oxysporum f. sp. lycopersici 4287]
MDENHPPSVTGSQGAAVAVTPQNLDTGTEIGEGSQSLSVRLVNDTTSTPDQVLPVRRGRGRPRGSKNKKTIAAENAARVSRTRFPSPVQPLDDGNDSHQSWMGDAYIPSNYGDSPYRTIDTSQLGSEDALLSPDKYENQAVAEFIKDYRNSVHSTREKDRESVSISKERTKEEEQYELAKFIDSHTWSQNQEDELGASWDNGVIKAAIQRLPDRGTHLSSVFKISFHLCNMDPLSLLSTYHDFEFDNSGSDSFMHAGQMKRNPLWAVICQRDNGEGFSAEEAHILSHLGCGNLGQFSGSPVLERFRFHQERLKTAGVFVTPHAKLLVLIADQVGVSAVPTSTETLLVRTGDLGVVISALDRLHDCSMNISCEVHYLQYCASRTSRSYPSGLEELLKAYKGVWMKLQRRKLCNAAVNQPPTQGGMFYGQADGQGVPANNNLLPNNAVFGGFPRDPQPVGHFEPESNPIRRLFDPDAGDLVRTIADHRDQLNPFRAFLANQRNRAQSNVRSPFVTQPDPGPAQEPRMNVIEDREVISIESSDEGMLEDQPEQTHNVPQVAGGRPRKRKGQRDRTRDRERKRKFLAKKERERRHGHRGQPHSSAPQRQGGNQGGAGLGIANQPQPNSQFNPPTGPRAWRQQHGGHCPF